MSTVLDPVLADLAAEGDEMETRVAGLDESGWRTPTPARGWDVATSVAHLAWTDRCAIAAATDKRAWDDLVVAAVADSDGFVDAQAYAGARAPGTAILADWQRGRGRLAEVLREVPAGHKLPWFGPPMSPASMATARFMETWAHGLDVAEGLGLAVEPTDRIRHVAHIGVRTRDFAFGNHGLEPPSDEFRVDLVSPSGDTWAWGPEAAAQTVTGSAYDFCLLVTQRRNRADVDLVAEGAEATTWLEIAQAFAGPPGKGREAAHG